MAEMIDCPGLPKPSLWPAIYVLNVINCLWGRNVSKLNRTIWWEWLDSRLLKVACVQLNFISSFGVCVCGMVVGLPRAQFDK